MLLKGDLIFYLTYLMYLPYLGKLLHFENHRLRRKGTSGWK